MQGHVRPFLIPSEVILSPKMDWLAWQGGDRTAVDQGEGPWPDLPAAAQIFSVKVNGLTAENAAWLVEESEDHPEPDGQSSR
jgi:hypothetical protein